MVVYKKDNTLVAEAYATEETKASAERLEFDVPSMEYLAVIEGVVSILTEAEVNTNILQTEIADRKATLRETFDSFPEADRKKMLEDELAKLQGAT